jgi:hypothetical protein
MRLNKQQLTTNNQQPSIMIFRVLSDGSRLEIESFKTITFPAGVKVLVTDPCYYFSGETSERAKDVDLWSEFCNVLFDPLYGGHRFGQVTYTLKTGESVVFLFSNTAFGDGEYGVSYDRNKVRCVSGDRFCVDAGIFSITLYDTVKTINPMCGYVKDDEFSGGLVFETFDQITVAVDGANMTGDIRCSTSY